MAESPDHEIQMELNVEQEQGQKLISKTTLYFFSLLQLFQDMILLSVFFFNSQEKLSHKTLQQNLFTFKKSDVKPEQGQGDVPDR
jgi:hypothetical protein